MQRIDSQCGWGGYGEEYREDEWIRREISTICGIPGQTADKHLAGNAYDIESRSHRWAGVRAGTRRGDVGADKDSAVYVECKANV